MMFKSALAVLSLTAATSATVFITKPTASDSCAGGSNCTVSWQDNGVAPALADFGNAEVFLGIGNAQQQTMLQTITTSSNVATTNTIVFVVDANAGANSPDYFIRVQSLTAKDPTNAQFPALSFSAKFTLTGMKGTFNATVQSEIDGLSTAPLGGGATSSSASSPTGGAGPTSSASTSSTKTGSTSTTKSTATGATRKSGAERVALSGVAGVVALFVTLFAVSF